MVNVNIKNILSDAGIKSSKTSELASGFNSTAHIIEVDAEKYILLIAKQGSTKISSSYLRQAAILEALSIINYQHAPKLMACADDGSWIITTYHEGSHTKDFIHCDVSKKNIIGKAMIDAHQAMRALSFKICANTFKKYGLELEVPKKWRVRGCYTFKAWTEVQKYVDDKKLLSWFEPLVTKELHRLELIEMADAQLSFVHGDLSALNVIVDSDLKVVFIDWELARFEWISDDAEEFGLPYMFIHNELFTGIEEDVISYTADKEVFDRDKLSRNVGAKRKMTELNDVLWSANMLWQSKKKIIEEPPETFELLLTERRDLFMKKYL